MRRRVTISAPDDVHSKIRESATAQGMSMSAWLERMLIEDLAAKGIEFRKLQPDHRKPPPKA
jgi:predicted HicB family RNase H-like nuclease